MIICIKNLRTETIIGVYPFEKRKKRPLILNVEMEITRKKGSDKLADTLDYDALAKMLVKEVESSRYKLIESLAEHLLAKLQANKRIKHALLEIDKPGAVKAAESVSAIVQF
jgi:dihydroneopterin aldolase